MCGSEHSFEEKNLVDICGAVGCIESGDSCGAVDCIGKNSLEVLTGEIVRRSWTGKIRGGSVITGRVINKA